jgi:alanine dehydrogenase
LKRSAAAAAFCWAACRAFRRRTCAILGGGVVGTNAAKIALGFGAKVTLVDVNLNRLRELDDIFGGRLYTLASNSYNVAQATREADLVIGGVLIPGATAPKIVTRAMVAEMKKGAVIVDVAIDQGGCVETARPTSHSNPSYRGGRRGALLRDQHAGRGAAHLHAGADQLDLPLPAAHRQPGRARALCARMRAWPRG